MLNLFKTLFSTRGDPKPQSGSEEIKFDRVVPDNELARMKGPNLDAFGARMRDIAQQQMDGTVPVGTSGPLFDHALRDLDRNS